MLSDRGSTPLTSTRKPQQFGYCRLNAYSSKLLRFFYFQKRVNFEKIFWEDLRVWGDLNSPKKELRGRSCQAVPFLR